MESADYRLHVAAAAIIATYAGAPCPMLPDGLVRRISSLAFSVVLSALSLGGIEILDITRLAHLQRCIIAVRHPEDICLSPRSQPNVAGVEAYNAIRHIGSDVSELRFGLSLEKANAGSTQPLFTRCPKP
jgi:hypothetical protein